MARDRPKDQSLCGGEADRQVEGILAGGQKVWASYGDWHPAGLQPSEPKSLVHLWWVPAFRLLWVFLVWNSSKCIVKRPAWFSMQVYYIYTLAVLDLLVLSYCPRTVVAFYGIWERHHHHQHHFLSSISQHCHRSHNIVIERECDWIGWGGVGGRGNHWFHNIVIVFTTLSSNESVIKLRWGGVAGCHHCFHIHSISLSSIS